MILSAMMFALGVFVSGLLWLALIVAMVRRAQRLTERRLLAGIATRRAEFETARDELRAQHAVQMYRLEREVSRVLDMATAYRLEADIKERDLVSARAELVVREEDLLESQERLAEERNLTQDLERRNAEAGSALRAAQHALKLETSRRALAENALDEAGMVTDQRRHALRSLRAENDALRAAVGEELAFAADAEPDSLVPASALASTPAETGDLAPARGSVVALPTRSRPSPAAPAEHAPAAESGTAMPSLAGEAHGGLDKTVWRTPAHDLAAPPAADGSVSAVITDFETRRGVGAPAEHPERQPEPDRVDDKAETRFMEALAQIRALKRAASQAGE